MDLPNRIQLRAWKIYGNGCIRYLGCDGDRLGIPGNVFRDPVFQGSGRKMRLYRIENVCQQIVASYDRKSLVYRRKDRSPL